MPQDVQQADMPDRHWKYRRMYKETTAAPPRTDEIERALALLATAKRPAILAGLGAVGARAESEIRGLAEHLGAPVATSLFAAGFCASYPLYLGISGGLGSELTGEIISESDVLIAFGASLNQWTTHFGQLLNNGKKIIQIDARADAFGSSTPVDVAIQGDAKIAATVLLERLRQIERTRAPNEKMMSTINKQKPESQKYEDGASIDPRRAAQHIEERLPKDERILVFDGGHAAMVCTKILSSPRAENWGLGLGPVIVDVRINGDVELPISWEIAKHLS